MDESRVGVRELKAHLSEYLRRVKAGETIAITEHGQTVGRIVPASLLLGERLQTLVHSGLAEWNGQPLPPDKPTARPRGDRTVADLLIEDRM